MNSASKEIKRKRWIGFRYAWNGIREATVERNIKIHLCAAVLVVFMSFWLGLAAIEWVCILTIIALVLSLEMINTSLERAMDYLAPEVHPLVGIVKDIAAGAVLVAAFFSLIIGIIIFLPKLLEIFG
ncbi:diacylglycerol kinase family protein [Thalassobacillus pellis]|uniref:diacylglycerol kinase family protein n=1 Tax=Thalassobacillus pellis TaxID=748008 RepID=UPI0019614D62|nr:diacylglycerol kinase family protein [Thalassobacillus pellis]MBM7554731.1 diacylglycerol kinase [Thalassobacillus pellis]